MGKTAGVKALSGSEGNEFRAWMVVAEAGVEMRGWGMEEPGESEGFGVTPPGVLVEGEGSSAVRAQEPGWGEVMVTMAMSLWSFSSAPSRGKRLLFAFLSSVFSIPFPPL